MSDNHAHLKVKCPILAIDRKAHFRIDLPKCLGKWPTTFRRQQRYGKRLRAALDRRDLRHVNAFLTQGMVRGRVHVDARAFAIERQHTAAWFAWL